MALLTHLWMCQICNKQPKSQEDRMVTELLCQHLKCRSCFISETNGCVVCQRIVTIDHKSVVTVNQSSVPVPKKDVGRRTQTKRLSQIANQLVVERSTERCQTQTAAVKTSHSQADEKQTRVSVISSVSRVRDEGGHDSVEVKDTESQVEIDQLHETYNKMHPPVSNNAAALKRKMIAKEVKPVEYGYNANGELYKKRAKPRFVKAYECVYCNRRFFNAGGMGNHIKYIHRDLVMRPKMTGDYSSAGLKIDDDASRDQVESGEKGVSKHFREINLPNQTMLQEEPLSVF